METKHGKERDALMDLLSEVQADPTALNAARQMGEEVSMLQICQWPYIPYIALYLLASPTLPCIFLSLSYLPYIRVSLCVLYQINRLNPKGTTKIPFLPWVCWPPNPMPLLHTCKRVF